MNLEYAVRCQTSFEAIEDWCEAKKIMLNSALLLPPTNHHHQYIATTYWLVNPWPFNIKLKILESTFSKSWKAIFLPEDDYWFWIQRSSNCWGGKDVGNEWSSEKQSANTLSSSLSCLRVLYMSCPPWDGSTLPTACQWNFSPEAIIPRPMPITA